jgi:hypothetical protein
MQQQQQQLRQIKFNSSVRSASRERRVQCAREKETLLPAYYAANLSAASNSERERKV